MWQRWQHTARCCIVRGLMLRLSDIPNWRKWEWAGWRQCRPPSRGLLTRCRWWPQLPRSTQSKWRASPESHSWWLLLGKHTSDQDVKRLTASSPAKTLMYIYPNQAECRTPTAHPPPDLAARELHSVLGRTFPGMGPSWWYTFCLSSALQRKDHLL